MPNSFLWIGLVALWLFVLFPMLADKHPRIRQTTDAALATRVLHRGGSKRRTDRGPASGHESDPNWLPRPQRSRVVARSEDPGTDAEDLMDTDAEEESTETAETEAPRERIAVAERDEAPTERPPVRRGRGGFDPEADAIARAERYAFRQRAVLGLVLATILTAALAVVISSTMWWVCGLAAMVLVGYLSYLRKQVRMEEDIRRRRMARLSRARLGVESRSDDELKLVPARLRRPGAVVLEVDDEDPVFDHLDHHDVHAADDASDPGSELHIRRAAGE
ncbi:divisome protein SepX/GlpR [Antrihabitans cavernicola]|uniref:Transmembrane protein n=1 Tax=Antrihabitans cavernicola TaxID=2495913 RepID=A0A5A7SF60_9NOCA|nr:gephyrin-like molybdotransferase receptor GlpR [Spelaeibacter cavernicola]KAA0023792.1 hypothetical protein FOY51_04085 [Spelaeibacter cavernicola]